MVLPTFSNQRSSFMIPGVFFHGVQTSKHFPVEMIATKLTQGYQHTLRRHTVHTLCTFGVRFVQKNVYLLHPKSLLLKRAQGGKTCNFGSFDCHPRPIVIKVEASGLSLANESGRLLFLPFCFLYFYGKIYYSHPKGWWTAVGCQLAKRPTMGEFERTLFTSTLK